MINQDQLPFSALATAYTGHWKTRAFQGSDEQTLAKFREVRDDIDRRMQAWLASQPIAA